MFTSYAIARAVESATDWGEKGTHPPTWPHPAGGIRNLPLNRRRSRNGCDRENIAKSTRHSGRRIIDCISTRTDWALIFKNRGARGFFGNPNRLYGLKALARIVSDPDYFEECTPRRFNPKRYKILSVYAFLPKSTLEHGLFVYTAEAIPFSPTAID